MATLISSKQIQGVVTASVVQGEFLVSGSLVVTGSGVVTQDLTSSGTITATEFVGSGTNLTFNGTGIISDSSQLTTELDSRYLNIVTV